MRGSVVQKPRGSGRWYVVIEMDRDPGTGARRRKCTLGSRPSVTLTEAWRACSRTSTKVPTSRRSG
jgi:hypothetical protein